MTVKNVFEELRNKIWQKIADAAFRVYHKLTIEESLLWTWVHTWQAAVDAEKQRAILEYDNFLLKQEIARLKRHDIIPGIINDGTGSKGSTFQ